jgi:hypothetical protein
MEFRQEWKEREKKFFQDVMQYEDTIEAQNAKTEELQVRPITPLLLQEQSLTFGRSK